MAAHRHLGALKWDSNEVFDRPPPSGPVKSGLWHPDAIERALAHRDPDRIRSAYNRANYWAERVRMAQWWSDHLDEMRAADNVIHIEFERDRSDDRTA